MKKQLLTAIAVFLSLCGYAQTKGTNALSFGISSNTIKSTGPSGNPSNPTYETKNKSNSYNLGYSHFIKDNAKVGIEFSYGASEISYDNDYTDREEKSYGGNVSYQKYFPIVKTLYAYAGGRASYRYGEQVSNSTDPNQSIKNNAYGIGAYGGVTWFVSKRFAFETSLLSADAGYSSYERSEASQGIYFKSKSTSFNISSQGFINNLGFKIYLLF